MVTVTSEVFYFFLQRHFLIRGAPGAARGGRGGADRPPRPTLDPLLRIRLIKTMLQRYAKNQCFFESGVF